METTSSSSKRDLPDGSIEVDIEVKGVPENERIKTLDDLMAGFGLDMEDYDLVSFRPNTWETHFTLATGDGGKEVYRALNYQAKATVRPSVARQSAQDAAELFRELVSKHSPRYRKVIRGKTLAGGENMAVVMDLFDLHIGMLAWAEETLDDDWDSQIGVALALDAVESITDRLLGMNISRIIFPIGNDLLHTDTTIQGKGGATTAGTPQDVDSRYLKMYRLAMHLMITIIDRLREIAPVDVIVVPGNHDRERMAYMGEAIYAWYRNDTEVTVDNSASLRKYTVFGKTLLGFTHGKDEKPETLPMIMAQECREAWAVTDYRVFHTGHIHRKRKMLTVTTDTYTGVEVITMPSLTPPESWHAMKGFIGGGRAAECHIIGENSGPCGYFRYNVPRPLDG